MIDQSTIQNIAIQLENSELSRQQIRQVSLQHPNMTLDDAYAIQHAWVTRKVDKGRIVRGHKVGLTSRAMQLASNISEPDFGVLLDDMFYTDGAQLPRERFIIPRVEVELAFVLGADLQGPNISLTDVLRATEFIVPAVEIIDARFHQIDPETGVSRKVLDTISDNAANAAVITGGRPVHVNEVDLRWAGAGLIRNGIVEETGLGLGVLNHPGNGVVWLANKLAQVGVSLKAGQIILSGSFTRPVLAERGDTFCADYGSLGTINFRFI